MLRDMENLLNEVYDEEVKNYFKEALKCYMGGSYRACVIMSVIAGMYDLHKKVKGLAGSNTSFKKLDEEIEDRKSQLSTYELYLIEQCATDEIDMLNSNELKELKRCLDTRNDCAHPSDFICSPEKARDIYSSIIDILASKPVLFGCKHMKNIIVDMEETTFFPVITPLKMKCIVDERLSRFQKKAIDPLLKSVGETIKQPKSIIQKNNAMRFLAFAAEIIPEKYEKYIIEFIEKDQYEGVLLNLFDININILNYLTDINIEKIVYKLETNLAASEISNIGIWVKIILSNKLQNEKFLESVAEKITAFRTRLMSDDYWTKRDVRFELVLCVLEDEMCSAKLKAMINKGCYKQFDLSHFEDPRLIQIIELLDDNFLYELWIKAINVYVYYPKFEYANRAISVFKSMPEEKWFNKVNKDLKIAFVKDALREGMKGSVYYSHSCNELIWRLHVDYPRLTETFLDYIFMNDSDDVKEFLVEKYAAILSLYIISCVNRILGIIDRLFELKENKIDVTYIIDNIKEKINSSEDIALKSIVLDKLDI